MWEIVIILLWLLLLSIEDYSVRSVSVKWLIYGAVTVAIYLGIKIQDVSEILDHVYGGVCGLVFVLISKWSNEALGYGDSIVLLILGVYLGIWDFLEVGFVAFFLCGIYGVITRKLITKANTSSIPFIPFILGGYIVKIAKYKVMRLQGSATVEMIYIMPIIFLVFLVVIYMAFFFHDKNALQGITYEAVVIGSSQYRTNDGIQEEEIIEFIQEKSATRMLFLPVPEVDITVTEDEITIVTSGSKNKLNIEVEKSFPLVELETKIRSTNIIEGVLD